MKLMARCIPSPQEWEARDCSAAETPSPRRVAGTRATLWVSVQGLCFPECRETVFLWFRLSWLLLLASVFLLGQVLAVFKRNRTGKKTWLKNSSTLAPSPTQLLWATLPWPCPIYSLSSLPGTLTPTITPKVPCTILLPTYPPLK